MNRLIGFDGGLAASKHWPFGCTLASAGTPFVGVTGPHGELLVGEAYADDDRVFTGKVDALTVRVSRDMPGVRATADRPRRFRRRQWFQARAVQVGTPGALITRDGITARRPVKRTTFYRHIEPLRLVLP